MTRMVMSTLNQKWWDESYEIVGRDKDLLSPYERDFFQGITDAMEYEGWTPTVKQFNFLRQLAHQLSK